MEDSMETQTCTEGRWTFETSMVSPKPELWLTTQQTGQGKIFSQREEAQPGPLK